MTIIKSNRESIGAPAEAIFNLLADYRNFNELLPEQVTNWKVSGDACSFTIKGMADISLKISQRLPNTQVIYSSLNASPFSFELVFNIEANSLSSFITCEFRGDLNPMLQMLAKAPLQNFVNMILDRLKFHFES
ncbi:MAG TPA: hypothetical protein DEO70_13855 [Bacteroidales bacterium]|nr:MAG: hypothetical protein A2X09_13955 [Bacteroidetes bacterium GWF2_43_11]HBZ67913.1 hypothetical protein [Bacteroidales bacterium]